MARGKIKVLLVEDSLADADLTRFTLEPDGGSENGKQGFEVETCPRLDDALLILSSKYVDVIILDLNLPDSRGLATFTTLQEQFSDIPVIILSGNQDENISLYAVEAGAKDYLIKGEFSELQLLESVACALQENVSDGPGI